MTGDVNTYIMCQSVSLLSVYLLCVYLVVRVILNQSASKSHAIFAKPTAHLTPCCIKHIAKFFWYYGTKTRQV